MLPKIIHYCWYGYNELPPLNRLCLESWEKKLTGYEFKRWDESNTPISDYEYMRLAYQDKKWAFVADYMRFKALYEFGGIYLDTDIEIVKPLDALLDYDSFMACESKNQLASAIIACLPKSPFIKACLDWMDEDAKNGKLSYTTTPKIMQYTWDKGEYNFKVLEKEYFFPYNPYDGDSEVPQLMYRDITQNTYAIHHWSASWHAPTSWKEYVIKVLRFAKRNLPRKPLTLKNNEK